MLVQDPPSTPPGTMPSTTRRRFRGAAVAALALLAIGLTRPEVLTGAVATPAAALRVAGITFGCVGLAALARRTLRPAWLARTVAALPAWVAVVLLVVPYYADRGADDELPTTAADLLGVPDDPTGDDPTGDDPTGAGPAGADTPTEATPDVPAAATPPDTAPAVPAGPISVTTGSLVGLDGHRGSGTAGLWQLPDGTWFVRFEDFDVSRGPGMEVWLVPRDGAATPSDGTFLAAIDENRGDLNVALPAGFEPPVDGPLTILIWCEPFSTAIAGATQTPV